MAIFSKIDKKILIILIIALVVILLLGIWIYRYLSAGGAKIENSAGGVQTQAPATEQNSNQNNNSPPQVQIPAGGVQSQGENGGGTLSVCLDKCGDGICQKTDPNCGKDNNLNCICPETPQECPQDCK